jgi:predicted Abi (CAAX) family protease
MRTSKWVMLGLLGIICAIALICFSPKPQPAIPQEPSYALNQPTGNQSSFYPLKQDIDPKLYHSVGDWVGRLILPNPEEIQANSTSDWVWFQVYHAPDTNQDLIGETLRCFLENASAGAWLFWLSLSTILFLLYHPLNARYFYPPGDPMFRDWRFLVLAGWLGIACAVSYGVTRSLWSAVSLHWLAVIMWLFVFGRNGKLHVKQTEL